MHKCVILVGHGAVPADAPRSLVEEFKRLEARAPGSLEMIEADRRLRTWPRTPQTDPYKVGLEQIAAALQEEIKDCLVIEAYNEFCTPSLEEAFGMALSKGARDITVIPTMFTRGGIHSEKDIPEILAKLSKLHPKISVRYVWPFNLAAVAGMLAAEVSRVESKISTLGDTHGT
jgi:sirohydrochlorin cobaltochelatase